MMECSWIIIWCWILLQSAVLWAAQLERYVIPEVDQCSSHFRDISGAIVTSSKAIPLQYQDSACYLKFSTDGTIVTRKRLMLKFFKLRIDDPRLKLKIYDGRSQLSMILHEFTKGSSPPQNITESSSNFFTLELDLNGAPAHSFEFQIHVTAFETVTAHCLDYLCNNGYCINKDLACDNADSCFDGSDETAGKPANCKPEPIVDGSSGTTEDSGMKKVTKTVQKWVIGLIVVIAVVLVAIVVICVVCCLRRSKNGDGGCPPSPSGGPSTTMTTAYHVAPSAPPEGYVINNGTQAATNHKTNGDQETVQFLP